MRLIDANALMQSLGITNMDCDKCAWHDKEWSRCKRGGDFEDACCAIEDAPTIEPEREKGRWIPVSETPPEEGIRVQIQLDNGWIITGFYDDGYWYSVPDCGDALNGDAIQMDVLAWMPLPEAMKTGDD